MKIIVCGAGLVGIGIARQLANEDNHITIIDDSPQLIQKINDTLDVSAHLGFPSHPNVLEEAGVADAEMIIAVTISDEVNMIICQIAHSLFDVPIKIARIRQQNYLQPMWKDLYRHDHLPIDYIISPEVAVANAIMNRLHVPGAMDMVPFADGLLKLVEIRCMEDCPINGMTVTAIKEQEPHLKMSIIGLVRDESFKVVTPKEVLKEGDAVYVMIDSDHIQKVMSLFGHEEKEARRVLIVGGGNIGFNLAQQLEEEADTVNTKLIELHPERAQFIAGKLDAVTVINGDSLDREILQEANIKSTETIIAVSNDDEVNILTCLLAKRFGCKKAIALINKGTFYSHMVSSLGIDVTIDPRETTVSSILQHIRRGRVLAARSLYGGKAEVIEVEAVAHSAFIGVAVGDLDLPTGVMVASMVRNNEVLIPDENTTIKEDDHIVILSETSQVSKVDKVFSARLDYF